jgi:hypothetical protein
MSKGQRLFAQLARSMAKDAATKAKYLYSLVKVHVLGVKLHGLLQT